MSKLVYLKGLSTNLSRHSLKDGQILFTEDTGELYIDYLDSLSNKIIRQPIHDKELAQALQQYINSMNKVENKSSADIRSEITADDIENALGFLPVEELSSMPAEKVTYDNTESGLNGINVQAALDEVVEKNAVNQIGILTLEKELEDKASKTYVDTSISNLVDGAPETLNTLNELSAALGDDTNFATTVATQIGNIESDVEDIVDGTTTIAKATSAIKLATARTIRTNLGSTSTASFDGTANITPGVTGTLPVANGGTGATTTKEAQYNLLNDMNEVTSGITDQTKFAGAYITPLSKDGAIYTREASTVWDYIKSKISSVLGLTADNYKGTSAKATQDANGNNIANTYATKESVNNKVDKEESKGLSTNDYTTEEKEKLASIATGANKTSISFDSTKSALLISF